MQHAYEINRRQSEHTCEIDETLPKMVRNTHTYTCVCEHLIADSSLISHTHTHTHTGVNHSLVSAFDTETNKGIPLGVARTFMLQVSLLVELKLSFGLLGREDDNSVNCSFVQPFLSRSPNLRATQALVAASWN